jgi:UDP-N-acetylmuramoyl-tripeptide--D-alanyl-D-alanine ligase
MKPTFLREIALWGECANELSAQITVEGVSVDSRLTKCGDLFFALPGAHVDGHLFLGDAARRGAKAAVVHASYKGDAHGLHLIYASDVLEALKKMARTFVKINGSQVVAVTGSLGKTTTKEFIACLLRSRFNVLASVGNQNSQIGLPLSILNHVGAPADIFVLEMGMTHAGNITDLISIAPPDVAVVTAVTLVHACNFDSLEAIVKAKSEIFGSSGTKLGIYHLNSDVGNRLRDAGDCRKQTFSLDSLDADWFLESFSDGLRLKISDEVIDLPKWNLLGQHNIQNFLAAVVVARHFGVSWEEIVEAQRLLTLPERRLQVIEKGGATFVNDSYNACELSVKAALSSLPSPEQGGRKIAVIGEMLELGKFSESCHHSVGVHALKSVDKVICLGSACEPIYDSWCQAGRSNDILWKDTRGDVVDALKLLMKRGDVILLKGSRAKELWKVLEEME